MTKQTKRLVRPAKTQISLGIHPVWSESSLSAWWKPGPLATHYAQSEDSDQTGQMPRLIWVFAGRTAILLILSWGSWNGITFVILPPHSWVVRRILPGLFLLPYRWVVRGVLAGLFFWFAARPLKTFMGSRMFVGLMCCWLIVEMAFVRICRNTQQ